MTVGAIGQVWQETKSGAQATPQQSVGAVPTPIRIVKITASVSDRRATTEEGTALWKCEDVNNPANSWEITDNELVNFWTQISSTPYSGVTDTTPAHTLDFDQADTTEGNL